MKKYFCFLLSTFCFAAPAALLNYEPVITDTNGVLLTRTNFFRANINPLTNALNAAGYSSGGGSSSNAAFATYAGTVTGSQSNTIARLDSAAVTNNEHRSISHFNTLKLYDTLLLGNTTTPIVCWNGTEGSSAPYSVCFAYNSLASGYASTVLNDHGTASGSYSLVTGDYNVASGNYSACLGGTGSTASGAGSACVGGVSALAGNISSITLGGRGGNFVPSMLSTGICSIAFGDTGNWVDTNGDYDVFSGQIVSGNSGSLAGGAVDPVGNNNSIIASLGVGSAALGVASGGNSVLAQGRASFALGENVSALADNAFALGVDVTNSESNSLAIGFGGNSVTIKSDGVHIGTGGHYGTLYLRDVANATSTYISAQDGGFEIGSQSGGAALSSDGASLHFYLPIYGNAAHLTNVSATALTGIVPITNLPPLNYIPQTNGDAVGLTSYGTALKTNWTKTDQSGWLNTNANGGNVRITQGNVIASGTFTGNGSGLTNLPPVPQDWLVQIGGQSGVTFTSGKQWIKVNGGENCNNITKAAFIFSVSQDTVVTNMSSDMPVAVGVATNLVSYFATNAVDTAGIYNSAALGSASNYTISTNSPGSLLVKAGTFVALIVSNTTAGNVPTKWLNVRFQTYHPNP